MKIRNQKRLIIILGSLFLVLLIAWFAILKPLTTVEENKDVTLDLLDGVGLEGKRYQLLIGLGFLVIVLFSPDGLVGIWQRLRERYRRGREAQDAQMRVGGGSP